MWVRSRHVTYCNSGAIGEMLCVVNGTIMICYEDVDVLCLRGWQLPCFRKILPEIIC